MGTKDVRIDTRLNKAIWAQVCLEQQNSNCKRPSLNILKAIFKVAVITPKGEIY